MKKHLLSAAFIVCGIGISYAQGVSDTVITGSGYSKDVYYSLQKGSQTIVNNNNNWHLAFQMIPQGGPSSSVSIMANHATAGVMVYSLHRTASANFATLMPTDTVGFMKNPLYNDTKSWANGALNRTADPADQFDYGWGKYDINTHVVSGDSLYLITVTANGNTTAYKMTVMQYKSTPTDSISYKFRIASFSGLNDTTITIYRKDGYVNRAFAYYDILQKTFTDRESTNLGNWDLLFTKYAELVSQGPVSQYYPVTGVLSAPGVKVAEETTVGNQAATYTAQALSSDINTIGYDWKAFDMNTNKFVLDTMKTYFVRSADNGTIYKLYFTDFAGSATGRYVLNKSNTGLGIKNVATLKHLLAVAPNPSNGTFTVLVDDANTNESAIVYIVDMTGKVIKQYNHRLNKGLNAIKFNEALPSGQYLISVQTQNWNSAEKIIIAQ